MNWKYISFVVALAVIIGGGILTYQYWWLPNTKSCTNKVDIELAGKTDFKNFGGSFQAPASWKYERDNLIDNNSAEIYHYFIKGQAYDAYQHIMQYDLQKWAAGKKEKDELIAIFKTIYDDQKINNTTKSSLEKIPGMYLGLLDYNVADFQYISSSDNKYRGIAYIYINGQAPGGLYVGYVADLYNPDKNVIIHITRKLSTNLTEFKELNNYLLEQDKNTPHEPGRFVAKKTGEAYKKTISDLQKKIDSTCRSELSFAISLNEIDAIAKSLQ